MLTRVLLRRSGRQVVELRFAQVLDSLHHLRSADAEKRWLHKLERLLLLSQLASQLLAARLVVGELLPDRLDREAPAHAPKPVKGRRARASRTTFARERRRSVSGVRSASLCATDKSG